ncbi:MAG: hypothetical protein LDL07_02720 [Desulfarculus sp.]|nr:hypothetical protein [Desulfarculus sp.]
MFGLGVWLGPVLAAGTGLVWAGDQAPQASAPPGPDVAQRLATGRLEPGDSPWNVERAWGPPWRRYMVNLFQDEEHLVYRDPAGRPILLRFRAGQLQPPVPTRPPWVAAPQSGR